MTAVQAELDQLRLAHQQLLNEVQREKQGGEDVRQQLEGERAKSQKARDEVSCLQQGLLAIA